MKKKQSAVEKARGFIASRKQPSRRFYANWPKSLVDSMAEVKAAWLDGSIVSSARGIAEFLRQECKNHNVPLPSMSALEKWLHEKD